MSTRSMVDQPDDGEMRDSSALRALPDGALEGVTLASGYQIGEKLGKGGMAWVYAATYQDHPQALKILFSHMADDAEFRARFLREARIQQRLDHPHIVHVTDIIEERGLVGFALEYCNGGTLLDLLRQVRGPLPLWQIAEIFLPLLDAMGYAHTEGVIHRDLKPPNILLHHQDDVLVPKLTDFGIAKQFGDATLTQTGTMIGTLLYMSPEQVEESKSVDARADIYSLGILLYQLASGTLPFIGKSSALMMQILHDEPPPPHTYPPLRDVVMRCLSKDPAARFQTCQAFADALQEALAQCVEETTPIASSEPLPTAEPQTHALQGKIGVKPGGADTVDDLDAAGLDAASLIAAGMAHTLQLDLEDMASERERAKLLQQAIPPSTAEPQPPTNATPEPASSSALASASAETSSSTKATAPVDVSSLIEASAPAEASAPTSPPIAPPVAPPIAPSIVPPIVPSTGFGPGFGRSFEEAEDVDIGEMPQAGLELVSEEQGGLSSDARQSVLLGLVALGLLVLILGLWMGREPAGPLHGVPGGAVRPAARTPLIRVAPSWRLVQRRRRVAPRSRVGPRVRAGARKKALPGSRILGIDNSTAALQQRCESGDAPSCRHWGLRWSRSQEIVKQRKALRTMEHACDLRDLKACVLLGHWRMRNYLTEPASPDKAMTAWMQACRLGAREICFRLGQLWHKQSEPKRACRLYRVACLKQHAEGCLWQGWCVIQQTIPKRTRRRKRRKRLSHRRRKRYLLQARRLFQSACDLRSARGCNRLGQMYSDGTLGILNEFKARRLFEQACVLRSPHGCYNAALYALAGRGGPPKPAFARVVLQQACELGDAPACYFLGTLFHREQRDDPKAQDRALQLFSAACRYKMSQGCYHAGYMLTQGAVGVPSCAMAQPWLKRACELGYRPCRRCGTKRRLPAPPAFDSTVVRWHSLSQDILDSP